jgi:hypothetical protein
MSTLSDPAEIAALLTLRANAHHAVHVASRVLRKRDWSDRLYVEGRTALDSILVELAQAKWRLGQYDGTYADFVARDQSRSILERAIAGFKCVVTESDRLRRDLDAGASPGTPRRRPVAREGAEVLFADEVPLVAPVCPIVILQGSNFEMGRQYAVQVIDIHGKWIFEQLAIREFSPAQVREIARWKQDFVRFTPQVYQFACGLAAGANSCGLPMSEDHAVALFTGLRPPAERPAPLGFGFTEGDKNDASLAAYLGVAREKQTVGEDLCSAAAAWGRGTADGTLIAGASTDHDVTFETTIVAFPDDGHAYIYTPFSANGSIPMLGGQFMSGHPGFNSKGTSYVHHAGGNTGEPVEQWGYGVRRGPMILHALQYADSARAACGDQMRYPVGDTAISMGSGNGLFADNNEGYAVEARAGAPRTPKPIVRTHSYDAYGTAYDFLYANNNAIDPRSGHLNAPPPEGYRYSLAGGWFTFDPAALDPKGGGAAMRRVMAKSSEARNRYAYRMMMEGYGRIDLDYMTMVYRQSTRVPEGSFEELTERWNAGAQWDSSIANRHNAHVAIIKPTDKGGGVYRACIGAADRAVETKDPGHGYHLYDEANAFWEIRLKSSPEDVVQTAAAKARDDFHEAEAVLAALPTSHAGRTKLGEFLGLARENIVAGDDCMKQKRPASKDESLALLARAVRKYTTAQVRARQVIEAIKPPPTRPDMLAR